MEPDDAPAVQVGGLVEAYGALDTNLPDDGVIALRGFDARSGTFALSLAMIEVGVTHPVTRAKVALQTGPTPLSYFAAEPVTPAGFGVAATSGVTLHPVREAWAGAQLGRVAIDGGVFLSPVGYDAIAAHDNPCWSLSNLGVGLPFYFTGARAALDLGAGATLTAAAVNGWNSIIDNNRRPAGMVSLGRATDRTSGQLLWLVGDEGTGGVRQLFDAWGKVAVGPIEPFVGVDVGFEPRPAGTYTWQAAQAGAVWSLTDVLSATLRGDVFRQAGPGPDVFWPTDLLGEGTASLGVRPADGLLVRLEARYDRAADPVFLRGLEPTTHRTTVTVGVSGGASASIPVGRHP